MYKLLFPRRALSWRKTMAAALEAAKALELAEKKRDAGDDAGAMRMVEKSLRIHATAEADALKDWLLKHGTGSERANAVERVLNAPHHYAIFNLEPFSELYGAEGRSAKKEYFVLSKRIHPDKSFGDQPVLVEGLLARVSNYDGWASEFQHHSWTITVSGFFQASIKRPRS